MFHIRLLQWIIDLLIFFKDYVLQNYLGEWAEELWIDPHNVNDFHIALFQHLDIK